MNCQCTKEQKNELNVLTMHYGWYIMNSQSKQRKEQKT